MAESGEATSTYGRSGELPRFGRVAAGAAGEPTEDESESFPSESSLDSREARPSPCDGPGRSSSEPSDASLSLFLGGGARPCDVDAAGTAAAELFAVLRVLTSVAAGASAAAFLDRWCALRSVVYSHGRLRRYR